MAGGKGEDVWKERERRGRGRGGVCVREIIPPPQLKQLPRLIYA